MFTHEYLISGRAIFRVVAPDEAWLAYTIKPGPTTFLTVTCTMPGADQQTVGWYNTRTDRWVLSYDSTAWRVLMALVHVARNADPLPDGYQVITANNLCAASDGRSWATRVYCDQLVPAGAEMYCHRHRHWSDEP